MSDRTASSYVRAVLFSGSSVPAPANGIFVEDSSPPKEVQGAAHGDIDSALACGADLFEVCELRHTSGVRHRDSSPVAHQRDELLIDSLTQSLHIGSVNQELTGIIGKHIEGGGHDLDFGERLPAVHRDTPTDLPVCSELPPTTQIQHDPVASHTVHQIAKSFHKQASAIVE